MTTSHAGRRAVRAPRLSMPASPGTRVAADAQTEQLKKLTARTLDALKNPAAIPSVVIFDALLRARTL